MRQFGHAKLNLHITSVRNSLGILHCLPGIGKQSLHFLFTLYKILTALITHTVLIRKLLTGLQTKQNIMGLRIRRIRIMHVVGGYQRNLKLSAHFHKLHINRSLFRYSMVLHFQKVITFTKALFIFQSALTRLIHKPLGNISLHLSRQTGRQCNNTLVIAV